ncbi:hypothetical protein [Xylophilus sp. GOD-11R]|uniref:hypothetical protein n=1 Tax=Xylophilus sp. GOD-11R TaxID=3089814 RepID=UPI00298C983A|nr:hypothetical protein [Xylophilus sp. GOD-11R]WPB58058.1 hypothetical protein R9X41_05300 [Xylophilus sp. GOD-11R]
MKRALFAALLAAGLAAVVPAASAQELPPGVRLGMGLAELRQALPALERVRRPQRLAGGLVGAWQVADAQVAGVIGTQTYYLAGGELRRIEFMADTAALPDGGSAAFDAVVAAGRERWGPERPAQDAVSRYAAWSTADIDAYARLLAPPRAALQLVISARPPRDDRQL